MISRYRSSTDMGPYVRWASHSVRRPSLSAPAEEHPSLLDRFHEGVDVRFGVVDVAARAVRRGDVVTLHQRLRAVVTSSHGDAFAVQDRRDVVRVDELVRFEHVE